MPDTQEYDAADIMRAVSVSQAQRFLNFAPSPVGSGLVWKFFGDKD